MFTLFIDLALAMVAALMIPKGHYMITRQLAAVPLAVALVDAAFASQLQLSLTPVISALVIALQVVILGLGLTVPRSRRLREAVTVLLPFLALGSLLLEPVIVDTASLFPTFAPWLEWLPLTLFCRGCSGDLLAMVLLTAEGAALWAVSLLPDKH